MGLTNFEQGEEVHSEALLSSAKHIDSELSKLNIEKIIGLCDNDPELNEVFSSTVESIIKWEEDTKDRIEILLQKADKQIQTRKSAIQSGFEKRKYPSFNGDPLSYFAFKKRWKVEVESEIVWP